MQDQAEQEGDPHICVMHSDAPEDAQILIEAIQSDLGIKNIPTYELPPTIIVYAGPGAMGVGFIGK